MRLRYRGEQVMRLQTIVLATLGLVIAASFVLNGRARAELPSATSQKEAVHIICPLKIQAGPANVPAGWQSLGNLFYQRRSISIDLEKHLIVCWYGEGKPFPPYVIAKAIPSGYVCKILEQEDNSFANFEAECHLARRRK